MTTREAVGMLGDLKTRRTACPAEVGSTAHPVETTDPGGDKEIVDEDRSAWEIQHVIRNSRAGRNDGCKECAMEDSRHNADRSDHARTSRPLDRLYVSDEFPGSHRDAERNRG